MLTRSNIFYFIIIIHLAITAVLTQSIWSSLKSLNQYCVVKGVITDEKAQPVNHVWVDPVPHNKAVRVRDLFNFSDDLGRWKWILPPGKYDFKLKKAGYDSFTIKSVEVKPGKSITLKNMLTSSQ
ncbi:carboxypeptidase-like regulatory domain-containing protein [Paenactinomyces guangxiensis]|uniref:Carboxypeptidase regulatory-like domain-containing protein n=1 Tax=Paenactinomyces guangxiensis TaxID=1490290 RepID=A0A7W2A885_9BACL|nr:carboxypeptidase-like regulatory domain-containing protein [Paenactinomyces guangxiensis]MBA4493548.1 carboxypeptidase regulatory-like domain-containing protein [Paenactinomyces guangxiensis]MBH8590639.1 carboxypeptidase regulatory-like domain-containing protein [Paenactinomyces guangxiensis]